MSQTIIEKIVQRFVVDHPAPVKSGDYVTIRPKHVLTHDNTGAVIPKFNEIGIMSIKDPRQPVFALDHDVQNKEEKNLQKYAKIEAFAAKYGIDFYPAGTGIGHQIMCDEGYAFPNTLAVASDSHSNMYGGLGCLGTPIVRTDAAGLWVTGETWWQIPPIARVVLEGVPQPGVTGKDIALALCGLFNHDEVLNFALEFHGEALQHIGIEQRMTIANISTEWGALVGLFPVDNITLEWYDKRNEAIKVRGLLGVASDRDVNGVHPRINDDTVDRLKHDILSADPDAAYAKVIRLDVGSITPVVSGPHNLKKLYSAAEINQKKIPIHKAYLLSCVNGRYEDFVSAANAIAGKKVAKGVELYIGCASKEIQTRLIRDGIWQTLLDAGAIELPPGCGPCIGLGKGLLDAGQTAISATNRNFKGRMGSKESEAYLGSPATVALSAAAGHIVADDSGVYKPVYEITEHPKNAAPSATDILPGFPEALSGRLLFCPQDNLNTDGIYPGKYTYIDTMTDEQQAQVVMENYDPEFVTLAREGDILAGGFNFGTGSSREQAATAFKHKGIRLVIAGSFNETYKRNAINNGFIAIECEELVRDLKKTFEGKGLTVDTGYAVSVDFRHATIKANLKDYSFTPLGSAAQRLIIRDGLLNMIKNS
ncbi:MAG: homoaconitase [Candidatus Marinimicrobia bacterium]|nr:homoaconitase [Candidatus Neomarinimicrobiota bacterium]